jgi:hypothetical protein
MKTVKGAFLEAAKYISEKMAKKIDETVMVQYRTIDRECYTKTYVNKAQFNEDILALRSKQIFIINNRFYPYHAIVSWNIL